MGKDINDWKEKLLNSQNVLAVKFPECFSQCSGFRFKCEAGQAVNPLIKGSLQVPWEAQGAQRCQGLELHLLEGLLAWQGLPRLHWCPCTAAVCGNGEGMG